MTTHRPHQRTPLPSAAGSTKTTGPRHARLAGTLLTALLVVGCHSTGVVPAGSVDAADHIIRSSDRVEISRTELYAELAGADVIYLGEKHDVMRHHELQLEVLEALIEMGRRPALGIESFSLPQSGPLMDYVGNAEPEADSLDAEAAEREAAERLRKRIAWGPSMDEAWSWYAPLLRFARRQGLPVFGADLPRSLRQRIGERGIDGLSPVEKRLLFPSDFTDPDYEALMHVQIKAAHCGWGPPDYLDRMYQTWIARNDAMSMAIAETLADRPGEPIVVILGAGHTLYDMAVYERVMHRRPGVRQVNLAFRESASGTEPQALRMRMMPVDETRVSPDHHYLWFTLTSDDSDENPCARFLRDRPPAAE